jgi:predicted nucleic acid-binding protein
LGARRRLSLYAESSAVLSLLLAEPRADAVRESLAGSDVILTSELTLIECDRALIKAVATGRLSEGAAADRSSLLRRISAHWVTLGLDPEIVDRARRPFPAEPIRALDALHLAYALFARSLVPESGLLSLDQRVRSTAKTLGMEVVPG